MARGYPFSLGSVKTYSMVIFPFSLMGNVDKMWLPLKRNGLNADIDYWGAPLYSSLQGRYHINCSAQLPQVTKRCVGNEKKCQPLATEFPAGSTNFQLDKPLSMPSRAPSSEMMDQAIDWSQQAAVNKTQSSSIPWVRCEKWDFSGLRIQPPGGLGTPLFLGMLRLCTTPYISQPGPVHGRNGILPLLSVKIST